MAMQILILIFFALNIFLLWINRRLAFYRVIGNIFFLFIPLTSVFFEQPRFELDYFWWQIAGCVLTLLGLALLAWAKGSFKGAFSWNDQELKTLAANGPYQFVRHPVYLGLAFIFVGWWWVWAAVYAFYFGMFILVFLWFQGYLEEKLILENKFGEPYKAYRQNTGMFWIK